MNKKILEFASTSHLDVYALGRDRIRWQIVLEHFAELIILECISRIENEAAQYAEPVWAFEIVNDIKEHFGVIQ